MLDYTTGPCELLVTLSSFDDETAKSIYHYFKVGNEDSGYQLHVRGYNSSISNSGDALEIHNKEKFTTRDRDHDMFGENCAVKYHGAWWYKGCFESNLNGHYYHEGDTQDSDGIVWYPFTGFYYSVKKTSMAIIMLHTLRPVKNSNSSIFTTQYT